MRKLTFGLLVLGLFLFIPKYVWAVPNCNFIIGANVAIADGKGNFANVRPGDTVCIASGSRSGLRLVDFTGTASAPITFINSGGKVVINDANIPLELYGSQYVRITGTGDSSIKYGIGLFGGANSGFNTNQTGSDGLQDGTEYVEFDHVEIGNVGAGIRAAKNNDLIFTGGSWTGHQFHIHDVYMHDTTDECMYIGTSTTQGNFPIHDVQIHNNDLRNCGWDGIQVRQGHTKVLVHHNIINGTGADPRKNGTIDNTAGFNIAKGTDIGDWYSNVIIGARKGAYIKDVNNIRFYNNVLINNGHATPYSPVEGAIELINVNNVLVANNTVVNTTVAASYGISVSSGATVRDNIVAGTFSSPIKGSGAILAGNITNGDPNYFKFVSISGSNFHLQQSSPAINMASNSTFPTNDFDLAARAIGGRSDVGAFEFGGTVANPTGDGDVNLDGSKNALDLKAVLAGYLKSVTNALNQYGVDSKVNALDFVVVLKRLP